MNALLVWLTSPEWAHAVKALLHTLWQGALVAVLLAGVLRFVSAPTVRYRCGLAAFMVVLLTGVGTWAFLSQPNPPQRADAPAAVASADPIQSSKEPTQIIERSGVAKALAAPVKWTAWLALGWIAGAVLMLGRAGLQLAGAERLRRSTRPLEDASVSRLLEEARQAVRLSRTIRAAVTEKLTSPAVVGVIVPTLILPLSLVTTLTPEQLRFVLLHELAHIQRGDYLANLFQLFAEALLFFNPAVWWISHQVRREREACCDALATRLSGAPADYARTLVHVAESFLPAPAAAAAFGDRRAPSSLAERVQRLLVPGYRPSLRLTWRAMLLALIVGSGLLFLSAAATRVTVAAILSPKERMARIEKKMAEYGVKPVAPNDQERTRSRVMITGRLRMADGSALLQRPTLIILSTYGNNSGSHSARMAADGTFSNAVPSGTIWVEAHLDDYAPAVSGSFDATTTNLLDVGDMVISRGFDIAVQLTDADSGLPVTNAAVKTAFILPSGHHLQKSHAVTSDAAGRAMLPQCVDQPLRVTINASGYEVAEKQFRHLSAGQTLEIKLRAGIPLAGKVVDKETGRGIADATIRIIHESAETDQHYNWTDNMRVLARTGESGGFSLTQLRRTVRYWLGVSAPGHESTIVETGAAGDLLVKLGPELIVRGRVIGNVDQLQKVKKMYASVSEQVGNSSYGSGDWVDIRTVNGVAVFEFTNRVAGPVTLSGTGYRERRQVTAPMNDWVVNLTEATNHSDRDLAENLPKREVVFRFTSSSPVQPKGTVRVVIPENLSPSERSSRSEEMAITNGEVRIQVAIGGNTSIEPRRMPGFWFNSGGFSGLSNIEVTNGVGPMVFEIPLVPAGAIYATARNVDGSRAGGLFFGIHELKPSPSRGAHGSLANDSDSVSGEGPRKWVSGPLPLGGTYQVYGWRGNSFCVSKPITLTEANPDAEVELQFGAAKRMDGVVVGPNGEPVRDARLEVGFALRNGHGFGLRPVFTDEGGRFRLEDAHPDLGDYSVQIGAPGLRSERVKLTAATKPQTIRLQRGEVLGGSVVEASTGYVLPDTEVRAVDLNGMKMPEQKVRTDAEGRFRFTTVGDVEYTLYIDAGAPVQNRKFRGGVDTNVTVGLKLYKWSKVQPKAVGERAGK